MSIDVLPDSRCQSPTGTVMVDWPVNGTTVRVEAEAVFCFHCGKKYGYVPRATTVDITCICNDCLRTHGIPPGMLTRSDAEFCAAVGEEMLARYGRTLTDEELYAQDRDHNLGPALEALMRDSRFPSIHNRPKGR